MMQCLLFKKGMALQPSLSLLRHRSSHELHRSRGMSFDPIKNRVFSPKGFLPGTVSTDVKSFGKDTGVFPPLKRRGADWNEFQHLLLR